MRAQTVLMLGGAGFVGHHITARLAADGHQIRIPTRHPQRHRDLAVLPGVSLCRANIADSTELTGLIKGCDAVIFLCGILNERRKGDFRQTHVELPRKVIECARRAGVHRILHMSALGADATNGHSQYQLTKGEGEALVHSAAGMQTTSFRPSVIFGPGDAFFNRFAGLLALTPLAFPLACANARFAPVYVGDVAHAFAHALHDHTTIGQRYDLCGPKQYTLKTLVEYAGEVSGHRRAILPLGGFASRLQARLLGLLPGKPFSMDNYLSMQRDNLCSGPFPALFGITPSSIESIVPTYLGDQDRSGLYSRLRRKVV